jgi:Cu+-exporting ATPase
VSQELRTVTLPVEGMTCAACVSHVQRALEAVEGVDHTAVNLATEQATVRYDPQLVGLGVFAGAIRDAGYELGGETVSLDIEGMTCASCVAHVDRALSALPGTLNVSVNLATEKATVTFAPGLVQLAELHRAVEDAGYKVAIQPEQEAEAEVTREERQMAAARRRMILSWAFTVPIILWMLPEMVAGIAWPNETLFKLGMLALAAPVLFWVGRRTYVAGWRSSIHGAPNMDALIALGTGASFLTGFLTFLVAVPSYAGVSAMIMTFHLTGRYVEASAKGRASQAIRKLLALGAKSATILVDGLEREVPIQEVQVGDLMVVRPGEQIPTDGVVVEGVSAIDESMATGESMPVTRQAGDEVIGATINQDGLLTVRATRIGQDTFLAQVVRLVEQAQGTKVPIQAFADRVTAVFVPIVLGVALLTLVAWLVAPGLFGPVVVWAGRFLPWVNSGLNPFTLALIATISVLVIACPCALGLATPTALMVGSGIGAENGILIRSGEAIQAVKDVRIVVLDKTGTLTKGMPEVTDVVHVAGVREEELVRWAASVEMGSEHPLGRAIVRYAQTEGLALGQLADFSAVRGRGVQGTVRLSPEADSAQTVWVGSRGLVASVGLGSSELEADLVRLEREGKTAMLVAAGERVLGIIGVADTLKDEARAAVRELQEMGLETVMITGDNPRTAQAIAQQVGIERVLAEVLPEDKLDEIRRLQDELSRDGQTGGLVAMVGDGINDAPALAQADVGIAIGTGTDIAIEAADITLVRGDLGGLISAIKLSRATFRKVVQGLFWAFFYNVVMIPLAILGLMHPVLAEIAMATSSITVVSNANLLRRTDIRPQYQLEG